MLKISDRSLIDKVKDYLTTLIIKALNVIYLIIIEWSVFLTNTVMFFWSFTALTIYCLLFRYIK